MIALQETYRKRPVRFVDIAELNGWRLKTYSISAAHDHVSEGLLLAAEGLAQQALPRPAVMRSRARLPEDRYGLGVLIVHDGREGSFVVLGWWVGENMLKLEVFFSGDRGMDFENLAATRIVSCTWELAVLAYERDAWVECILANPGGPDVNAWLEKRMNRDV
ncbi:MAG TPA: hypothetical protein VHG33_02010 [Woeseiaceae bacterium]|nr:hypothetical protein [Woeseiaceae bacterium]